MTNFKELNNDVLKFNVADAQPRENSAGLWIYCDTQGNGILITERFNDGDSKKVLPRYFSKAQNSWVQKQPYTETPLYNLETAKEKHHLPVLIVEGEKTAEAAKKYFGDNFWVTTWPGGCGQVKKVTIKGIKNRQVFLFPDNDKPGHKAMAILAERLTENGNEIHMISLPGTEQNPFEQSWDLADEFPAGWTTDKFRQLILDTPLYIPAKPEEKPDISETDLKAAEAEQSSWFKPIIPFPEPVDGRELIQEIRNTINDYVFLPPHTDIALAYWVLFTYGIQYFEFSPRLAILSPEKRCGKSTLLDVLTALCYRPLNLSHTTSASMFRLIEQERPTLLLDEADTFLKGNDDLRGIVNSGHRCNGAVSRVVGDKQEVKRFSTFSACAIASIGTLPDTIMDRSIIISMKRATSKDRRKRLRLRLFELEVQVLCRKCLRFMQDNAQQAASIFPDFVEGLSDRAFNNWEHLFAIADTIGAQEGADLRKAALKLSSAGSTFDTESVTTLLLRDIRSIFAIDNAQFISSLLLCKELAEKDGPWGEICRGCPITPNKLSTLLRDFGIKSFQKNVKGTNQKGYCRSDFSDAFSRYLGEDPVRTESNHLTPTKGGGLPTTEENAHFWEDDFEL